MENISMHSLVVNTNLLGTNNASLPSNLSHKQGDKLSWESLSQYFHLPILEASKELDICPTRIKIACRQLNLKHWPARQIQTLNRLIIIYETTEKPDEYSRDILKEIKDIKEKFLNNINREIFSFVRKKPYKYTLKNYTSPTKTISKKPSTRRKSTRLASEAKENQSGQEQTVRRSLRLRSKSEKEDVKVSNEKTSSKISEEPNHTNNKLFFLAYVCNLKMQKQANELEKVAHTLMKIR